MDAPIVITTEDVNAPQVDEQLSRQLSFGMAGAPPRVDDAKTGLLQRPWFALMLAGMVGGLAGWAAIEPIYSDGVRFTGGVEMVRDMPTEAFLGRATVGGLTVWISRQARLLGRDGPVALKELEGKQVEVRGSVFGEDPAIMAYSVRVRGPAGPAAKVDLANVELLHSVIGFMVFPLLAAFVGLFIGAADGLLSRAFHRGLVCGLVGLAIGLGAGLIVTLFSALIYLFGERLVFRAEDGTWTAVGFLLQMIRRGVAWSFAGAAMGLGQGVALRSKKMALNGLIGGMVGALLGGLLFDPIDYLLHRDTWGSGAAASRAAGFAVIGAVTGLMIGVVELLAREAWVKLLTGPLAGKEFVLYKNPTLIGSSPKADIYLFKDPEVEPIHAAVRSSGEGYEIEDRESPAGLFVNGRRIGRRRLESGDQIRIGKSVFNFTEKET